MFENYKDWIISSRASNRGRFNDYDIIIKRVLLCKTKKAVNMKLNRKQLQSFLTGNLLGDGSLANGSFEVKQINKDLINFKYKIFKRYLSQKKIKKRFIPANVDKFGVSRKNTYGFYVSPTKHLKELESEFYDKKGRVLPVHKLHEIDELGLAVWFADDGTTVQVGFNKSTGSARSRRVQICTDAYCKEEVEKIVEFFRSRYGKAKLIRRTGDKYRVQIQGLGSQQFLIDISPYFINYFPSLLYKLDLGYRNESLENRSYVTPEYQELYNNICSHPDFIDRLKEKTIESDK